MNQLTGTIRAIEIHSKIVNMEAKVQELSKAKDVLWEELDGPSTPHALIKEEYTKLANELTDLKNTRYVEYVEEF